MNPAQRVGCCRFLFVVVISSPPLAEVLLVEGLGWADEVRGKSRSDFFFCSLTGSAVRGGGVATGCDPVAVVLDPIALAGVCCWCFAGWCFCCCLSCCYCCCVVAGLGAGFFFSGASAVVRGPGFCGGAAGVLATIFSFSGSLDGSGRVESSTGTEVPSISRSMTDSGAGVGGGVAARGGVATFLSRECGSLAGSERGELIEECDWGWKSLRCSKKVRKG